MRKFKREKYNKGITLIALIITIIVILIISSIGITAGIQTTDSIKIKTFNDEMQIVQAKVDIIYEQILAGERTLEYLEEEPDKYVGGESYTDEDGNVHPIMERTFDNLNEEEIKRNEYKYYTNQALQNYLGVEDIDQSVLINWKTRDVISVEGISINGGRQYRLTGVYKSNLKLPKLNASYQELEYIESTGTQWIDTGFNPNNNTDIVYDFEYLSATGNQYIPILGIRSDYAKMFGLWIQSNSGLVAINYRSTDTSGIASTSGLGRHVYSNNGNKFYLDGKLITEPTNGEFQADYSLAMFGLNKGTATETRGLRGRVYSLKIFENDTIVRDFIPCYRISDKKTGMYDIINDVFYENKVAEEFVKGPAVFYSSENKDVTIKTTNEDTGDIVRVTVDVTDEGDNPISDFTLKYKLEDENVYKIADDNYFETATEEIYDIEVSGNGINTKTKKIDTTNYFDKLIINGNSSVIKIPNGFKVTGYSCSSGLPAATFLQQTGLNEGDKISTFARVKTIKGTANTMTGRIAFLGKLDGAVYESGNFSVIHLITQIPHTTTIPTGFNSTNYYGMYFYGAVSGTEKEVHFTNITIARELE